LAPKGFHHNWMNLNHIGHTHILPRRDGTNFHLIVLVKVHVYFKQVTLYTYYSRSDFPKTWLFKQS